MSCDDKSRDWKCAAESQEMPKIADKPAEASMRQEKFPLQISESVTLLTPLSWTFSL